MNLADKMMLEGDLCEAIEAGKNTVVVEDLS